ncbi:hypothetical protein AAG906_028393 [Vitis piasezkii]
MLELAISTGETSSRTQILLGKRYAYVTLLLEMMKRHLRLFLIVIMFSTFITLQASAIAYPRDYVGFNNIQGEIPYGLLPNATNI